MYNPRVHLPITTARANAIYRRAIASQAGINMLNPTQKLFARSGYGWISPPDAVIVPAKIPAGIALASPKAADQTPRRNPTAKQTDAGVRNGGRRGLDASATEDASSGRELPRWRQITSLSTSVPIAQGVSASNRQTPFANRIAGNQSVSLDPRAVARLRDHQLDPVFAARPVNQIMEERGLRRRPRPEQQERDHTFDFEPFETASPTTLFTWLMRLAHTGGKVAKRAGPKTPKPPQLGRPVKGPGRQRTAQPNSGNPGHPSPGRVGRTQGLKQRVEEVTKQALEREDDARREHGVQRIEDVYLEIRDYLRKNPYLPESYWFNHGKRPTQTSPGVRMTHDEKKASTTDKPYPRTTHFDMFGREIGQTHRTHHGQPDPDKKGYHPNPHHHRRNVLEENSPYVSRDDTKKGKIWRGLFGYPWQ